MSQILRETKTDKFPWKGEYSELELNLLDCNRIQHKHPNVYNRYQAQITYRSAALS